MIIGAMTCVTTVSRDRRHIAIELTLANSIASVTTGNHHTQQHEFEHQGSSRLANLEHS
jgi:hypothetical protein